MQDGFTVFVVRSVDSTSTPPNLPQPDKFVHQSMLQPHQLYLNDRDMESLWDEARRSQDKEAKEAQGIADGGDGGSASFGQVIDPRKKAPETDWSKLGAGNTLGGGSSSGGAGPSGGGAEAMDDDLAAAIAASMADMEVGGGGPRRRWRTSPDVGRIGGQCVFVSCCSILDVLLSRRTGSAV